MPFSRRKTGFCLLVNKERKAKKKNKNQKQQNKKNNKKTKIIIRRV